MSAALKGENVGQAVDVRENTTLHADFPHEVYALTETIANSRTTNRRPLRPNRMTKAAVHRQVAKATRRIEGAREANVAIKVKGGILHLLQFAHKAPGKPGAVSARNRLPWPPV